MADLEPRMTKALCGIWSPGREKTIDEEQDHPQGRDQGVFRKNK